MGRFYLIVTLAFASILSGCNILQPPVPDGNYVPLIASSVGVATSGKQVTIGPVTPDKPSALCKNCKGRGKIGDGRTMVTCPICNGTGKGSGELPPEEKHEGEPAQVEPAKVEANFKPDESAKASPENPVVAVIYTPSEFFCPGCEVMKGEVAKLYKDHGWNDKQIRFEAIPDATAVEIGISAYPTLEVRNGSKILLRRTEVLSASELTSIINPLRIAANEK